ncbi:MAG: aroA [Betaproteobacteria bacterium]|nr:aroA [Betaproteobacteria bacterium]
MQTLTLAPAKTARGNVVLPGSKSISNRTLLLAALSRGTTRLAGLLDSDDTRVMLKALGDLRVPIARDAATGEYLVTGVGGQFANKSAELFMGNAGTAIRPLTAALALQGGTYKLAGVPRMHERPIGDLVDGLRAVGANISYLGNEGFPPLKISPAAIKLKGPVQVRGDVSSQFLTALLMALPLTGASAAIEVVGELISKPYVDITLNLMQRFGVAVKRDEWRAFHLPEKAQYASPGKLRVEGDASSASYFLAAGALGGGPVRVEGVGRTSIQGDVRFAESLNQMGVNLMAGDTWIEVRGHEEAKLRAIDADFNHIPDAAMTIAVLALFADGPSTLRNIGSWRVKETDRISAMATELTKLGAEVEAGADYLRVMPPKVFKSAAIDTYDDHRMAMCFSLACFGGVPVTINDPQCVNKTFPEYFSEFARVVQA